MIKVRGKSYISTKRWYLWKLAGIGIAAFLTVAIIWALVCLIIIIGG